MALRLSHQHYRVRIGLLPNVATGLRTCIPQAGYVILAYVLGVVTGAPLSSMPEHNVSSKRLLLLSS